MTRDILSYPWTQTQHDLVPLLRAAAIASAPSDREGPVRSSLL
jgi:hypothetical protein